MRSFTLFLSLFMFLLFNSCGENTKKEDQKDIEEATDSEVANEDNNKVILFFGDSLTAGYGLEQGEAFPAIIQQKIDSLGLSYQVVNAGLSGETTSGGKNRIDWVLKQNVDVFILELGANDGLRGIQLSETRANLQEIIDFVREKNPDIEIILAGMQIPPNMGQDYTTGFRNIFPELAEKNNVQLIPFLLEGVAGDPELNQQDGIHPTAEGQKILAENVWEVLKPVLMEEMETAE
ncbi:acyl-CoA thioesterase-1 [Christiangramia gaetbulicola]|uniref:Acyl-CoA thioesterase-1 n=1 Tax=Christiangramia gaetbulicola TaxID=703340 RepID=A0A2T6AC96_9FLAO|nr:arylesterase [Christiangramia gaetbulicola]PTX41439.1 acyl-CoA thioesterase-1 [Christiangramia gaetbulicola]